VLRVHGFCAGTVINIHESKPEGLFPHGGQRSAPRRTVDQFDVIGEIRFGRGEQATQYILPRGSSVERFRGFRYSRTGDALVIRDAPIDDCGNFRDGE